MPRPEMIVLVRHEEPLDDRRVTEAELIRRSIDQALSSASPTPDPEAWKKLKRSMAQVRKKYGPGRILPWTRDELYDR